MMPPASIEELCSRIAVHDDEPSFENLFRLFYPRLLSFSESLLKSRQLAEEAVQDVFLKLWENRKILPAIKNLNYYLFTAVKHATLNYLAKYKNKNYLPLEDLELELVAGCMDPENVFIAQEKLKAIQAVINTLPPKCRLIFQLVKESGLKHKEVAELLNLSLRTVEKQVSIGLQKVIEGLVSADIDVNGLKISNLNK